MTAPAAGHRALQGTLGGVLRPGAESHVCFMVLGHRLLFPRQTGFHDPGRAPVEPKPSVFISEPPRAPLDPSPSIRPPGASSSRAAALNPCQPPASSAPAAKPSRQSRRRHASGPAALGALEQRDAAERQAQLRHAPQEPAAERPAWAEDNSEIVIHLHLDY